MLEKQIHYSNLIFTIIVAVYAVVIFVAVHALSGMPKPDCASSSESQFLEMVVCGGRDG